jgi:hypothetical protein
LKKLVTARLRPVVSFEGVAFFEKGLLGVFSSTKADFEVVPAFPADDVGVAEVFTIKGGRVGTALKESAIS